MKKPTLGDESALRLIKDSPELQSFLRDMDLLPEQLEVGVGQWHAMKLIVAGYYIGKKETLKTIAE